MDVIIRQAATGDAGKILSIYAPFILNTTVTFETVVPSEEEFAGRIASISSGFPYLTAFIGDTLAGYAYAHAYRERAAYRFDAELSVYIHPDYRRIGIARKLYNILSEALKQMNYRNLYAVIALPNEQSELFHRTFGFKQECRSLNTGFKAGQWLDTATYSKQILPYSVCPSEIVSAREIDLNKIISEAT